MKFIILTPVLIIMYLRGEFNTYLFVATVFFSSVLRSQPSVSSALARSHYPRQLKRTKRALKSKNVNKCQNSEQSEE